RRGRRAADPERPRADRRGARGGAGLRPTGTRADRPLPRPAAGAPPAPARRDPRPGGAGVTGAWGELERRGPESVAVDGVEVRSGSRVVLRPTGGGDVFDLA